MTRNRARTKSQLGNRASSSRRRCRRWRNPLVWYITGDIGSLHPLPENACGSSIPESELQHFRVLRLRGRDRRFSFEWFGEYFDFQNVSDLMQSARLGVLQWQLILDRLDSSPQGTLEVRILRAVDACHIMPREEFFFWVFPENRYLFRLVFVDGPEGFEKSSTGGKVIRFVDRFNQSAAT
ncbi:uncharacterized protein BDW43DRAFT_311342 [Aspergillus alliaceus]|uniref:uncharacterized protein n=1 Tax=Petromyces alliaceus TaxID=209559 RepID=UPI0012A68C6C|nr:uncharacterized protein BDW43DRAFT_311342 [Aspergillus alliaceus]KAB8233264.1 hypothetical protein BDW43DRAFT_311342 [Aspergillus alliaceus]